MNSALQCLSHIHPVVLHLLTNQYKADLNPDSKLGTGGRLPSELDTLMKDLWFGSQSVVNPSSLRKVLPRLNSQFAAYAGTAQHDAQVRVRLKCRVQDCLGTMVTA